MLERTQDSMATLEDSFAVSHKTKHTLTIRNPSVTHLGIYFLKRVEKLCPQRNLHTDVHSSSIHNCQIWKQLKCPSVGEWINKVWYIQTMEHYAVLKRNELSVHGKSWRNLKCILLSERSQSENATYSMILSILHSGKGQTIETVKIAVAARVWWGKDE